MNSNNPLQKVTHRTAFAVWAFVIGLLLLSWPFLAIPAQPLFYLFAVWGVLILCALAAGRAPYH